MSKKEAKKHKQMALEAARVKVGAHRSPIEITDREWDAIQSGAITESKLSKILDHANIDQVKQRATPRQSRELSSSEKNVIRQMKASGYTIQEIAERIGRSASTVSKEL